MMRIQMVQTVRFAGWRKRSTVPCVTAITLEMQKYGGRRMLYMPQDVIAEIHE